MSHIDYFSSMCVSLTSSRSKKHSNSNHIFIFVILLISSPFLLMTCSSSSHSLQINRPPKFQQQHTMFHHSYPVQPVSITEVRSAASHQHLVTALPNNICTVTTSASSTATSGIFDPSVTMSSLVEVQPVTPLTLSTSFLSDENVNLNTRQPGGPIDEG